ncbi:Rrf2 family transcriptional regulator, partial [Deltaproteobacteria bacterium OttesenSCG-928-K17]|nr:Rrf2 family transcriptional regulator [Deltaproteobacteria bacterium OttesenSCG-928-K17]
MSISVKCQYAIRALFELGKRRNQGLVRLQDVAAAQRIPQRFLENILNQLRQGGFVESRRGKDGGFVLLRQPAQITICDVVVFIDGPIYPVECGG